MAGSADDCSGCTAWAGDFGLYMPVGFTWPEQAFFLLSPGSPPAATPGAGAGLRGAGSVDARAARPLLLEESATKAQLGAHDADLGLVQPRPLSSRRRAESRPSTPAAAPTGSSSSCDALPDVARRPQVDSVGAYRLRHGPEPERTVGVPRPRPPTPATSTPAASTGHPREPRCSLPLCHALTPPVVRTVVYRHGRVSPLRAEGSAGSPPPFAVFVLTQAVSGRSWGSDDRPTTVAPRSTREPRWDAAWKP